MSFLKLKRSLPACVVRYRFRFERYDVAGLFVIL